jgi:hypothetical protein
MQVGFNFIIKNCHPECLKGDPKKKFMTFSDVEAITTRLPSWTGGESCKPISGKLLRRIK